MGDERLVRAVEANFVDVWSLIGDSAGRGYAIGVLQSSKLGYRVYGRLGFREVCQLTPYIRPLPPPKA